MRMTSLMVSLMSCRYSGELFESIQKWLENRRMRIFFLFSQTRNNLYQPPVGQQNQRALLLTQALTNPVWKSHSLWSTCLFWLIFYAVPFHLYLEYTGSWPSVAVMNNVEHALFIHSQKRLEEQNWSETSHLDQGYKFPPCHAWTRFPASCRFL